MHAQRRGRERPSVSGGSTRVVVMQSAEVWHPNDRAGCGRLYPARAGRILVQREVGPPDVIVREVLAKTAAQRALVPHDDVVETRATDGADHPFHERILPRRPGRRRTAS